MNFKPLFDRILVKRDEMEEKTAGGIILAESSKEKPHKGKVLAVGSGTHVKVEDKVLFSKYSGTEIKLDGETLLIMKEEDVLGVLANDNAGAQSA